MHAGEYLSFLIHFSWICPTRLKSDTCFLSRKLGKLVLLICPVIETKKKKSVFVCSVLTPYYKEEVLFSHKDLNDQNEDGVSILFYLQKIYPGTFFNLYCDFQTSCDFVFPFLMFHVVGLILFTSIILLKFCMAYYLLVHHYR
jgi:1,3-beta-glucan synthase component